MVRIVGEGLWKVNRSPGAGSLPRMAAGSTE